MNLHVRQIDPMNLTDEQIAELEQLDRESCPAPWHMHERGQEVLTSQSHPLATLSDGSHRLIEGRRGVHVGKDGPLIVAARNALPSLLAEVRSSRSSPDTAPWYEADGSTVMLPAEEVTRRRKLAAKVFEAARKVDEFVPCCSGAELDTSDSARLHALSEALVALDAASPSSSGENSASPAEDHAGDPGRKGMGCEDCRNGYSSKLAPGHGWASETWLCEPCRIARAREEGRREMREEAVAAIDALASPRFSGLKERIALGRAAEAVRSLSSRVIPGGA